MNVSLEKVTAPVAFAIIGFAMVVIGATGIIPITNQPVTESKVLFIIIGVVLILAALVSVWREQANQKTINGTLAKEQSTAQKFTETKYDIKITSPMRGQVFRGGVGDMTVDVSGTCRTKPLLGTTLRLFVRTQYGYWRQDAPVDFDNDGFWTSKIGLWKAEIDAGYDAYIIAAMLDEAGEDMVRYSKKVHEEGKVNISFWKLPHYIEKSEEVHIRRE